MTDLRKAAEMALDALEEAQDEIRGWGEYASEYFQKKHDLLGSIAKLQPTIEALRQALAKPEQQHDERFVNGGLPMGGMGFKIVNEVAQSEQEHFCDTHCTWRDHHPDCELAQPEQEPVAWLHPDKKVDVVVPSKLAWFDKPIPLYTAPISEPVKERISEPDRNLEPVCDKDPQGCWSIRCQLGKVCKNTAPPKRECEHCGKITKP